jgi:hypothetical protein
MSKVKDTKNKLKSKIEAIKKINDDPKALSDSIYDKYLKDLPSTDKLFGKKLDDFLEKRKKKNENNKDIFGELMEIVDSILNSNSKTDKNKNKNVPTKLFSKKRLKFHAERASEKTLEQSKEIILNNVKKVFFASDGESICGTNQTITIDSLYIKPQEFDFLNILTVDPTSATGQIVYEPTTGSTKTKVNRELYDTFSGSTFEMKTKSGDSLFDMNWIESDQKWNISGLTLNSYNVEEFLNHYYSSLELPDIQHIIKTSMLMTINSGESNPLFDKGLNNINRLLNKLCAVCGSPTDKDKLKNQNAVDLFDENDEDIELYFNFDDVEGIDLDDEDARYRKVLRFTDCNNFEIPVNKTMLEDFVYLSYKKTPNDLVESTLNRVATEAQAKSDSSIPQIQFNLNLLNLYILNLPKALIMSVFSPKVFLPIILLYKILKSGINEVLVEVTNVLTYMKNLFKLFYAIVKDLFWLFIREFWKLIKPDLIAFVMLIAKKILKNKYKRYAIIITALIALLTKILQDGIDNCFAIFNTILSTIQGALSLKSPLSVPGILLGLSDKLPGYSQDRAYLNIVERLENLGISTGPIFGESNNLPSIIKSIIDGHTEEQDTNSFISVSNKEMIIPSPVGPIIIPPGILNSSGKMF